MTNKMKVAVILGNGMSRKDIDIDFYKKLYNAPVFGCNGVYREYDVDFLIAFDQKIVSEIKGSVWPLSKLIVPSLDEQYEPAEANPNRPRNNSGMVAMSEAIKRGYSTLICFGFDFLLEDEKANIENLYDGTNGYGPETRASIEDTRNRCRFMQWFADKNLQTTFWFYFKDLDKSTRLQSTNILYKKIS